MNQARDITRDLQDWLHEPDRLPPPRISEVAPLVHHTPQQRGWVPPLPRRFTAMLNATSYLGVAVVLALVSGLLLTSLSSTEPPQTDGLVAGASATASVSPGPTPTTQQPDLVVGPGPWLAWEETTLARPGGPGNFDPRKRALEDAGYSTKDVGFWQAVGGYTLAVRPGTMTRSDKEGVLDGYQPLDLFVIRPDGSVDRERMDKPYDIELIAWGPKGFILRTRVDRAWLLEIAIDGRQTGPRTGDCCRILDDGTVNTDGNAGLPRVIPFDDWKKRLWRVGLDRSDLAQRQRYWLWQDGAGWSEIAKPPAHKRRGRGATDDGFYLQGPDDRIHFSPDGREWRVLEGELPETAGDRGWALVQRGGSALLTTGQDFVLVEPTGLRATPFAAIPAPDDESLTLVEAFEWNSYEGPPLPVLLPDIGPVYVHAPSGTAVLGLDGDHWGVTPLPTRPDPQWPVLPSEEIDLEAFDVIEGELVYAPSWTATRYRAVLTHEPPSQPLQ